MSTERDTPHQRLRARIWNFRHTCTGPASKDAEKLTALLWLLAIEVGDNTLSHLMRVLDEEPEGSDAR